MSSSFMPAFDMQREARGLMFIVTEAYESTMCVCFNGCAVFNFEMDVNVSVPWW